jgi:hypothetical protein
MLKDSHPRLSSQAKLDRVSSSAGKKRANRYNSSAIAPDPPHPL